MTCTAQRPVESSRSASRELLDLFFASSMGHQLETRDHAYPVAAQTRLRVAGEASGHQGGPRARRVEVYQDPGSIGCSSSGSQVARQSAALPDWSSCGAQYLGNAVSKCR